MTKLKYHSFNELVESGALLTALTEMVKESLACGRSK
jgi:hypothetical protein